ncbi:Crp/Fnr family transcriptional regulator [Hymenobacter psoromatis]|uniref:Crp/Fnr family transcriptional regulator n=1 Tax=Hymenobacter psoromatis TaxID=1484116 RepID=UPI001CBF8922|nr:Crp/Fnr family transcriptional regulator [Hymenobacter psoromatis]
MHPLHAFFNGLWPVSDQDFARLLPHVEPRAVAKGAHLLEAGQVCEAVFFVTTGFFRMYYVGPDGHEVNCRFTGANGFLTDFQSFLTQQPSRYAWQAVQAAEVLALPHALVQQLYRKSPAWERVGRLMAERVYQQLNERVELLQFYTPTQRYEYVRQQYPELLTQISQAQLASYLGVQPESLSRIRHRLSQKKG